MVAEERGGRRVFFSFLFLKKKGTSRAQHYCRTHNVPCNEKCLLGINLEWCRCSIGTSLSLSVQMKIFDKFRGPLRHLANKKLEKN